MRRTLAAVAAFLVFSVTHACVGDDPAPSDGDAGGVDSSTEASADAGSEGAAGDSAPPDASGDADGGSCNVAVPVDTPATFVCETTSCTVGSDVCCRRTGGYACGALGTPCSDTDLDVQCDGPSDCGSLVCCLAAKVTGSCPATTVGTPVRLVCNAAVNCTGAERFVTCNGPCGGGKTCTPLLLPTGRHVGVCL